LLVNIGKKEQVVFFWYVVQVLINVTTRYPNKYISFIDYVW
jgi:hypothetical protein